MPEILQIFEKKNILSFLRARGLLKQYKKAKQFLLEQNLLQVKFKEKNPKGSGIWYFKINKQFRALGVFDKKGNLIIFKIDNHQ
jgi:plasmid maintenance system killer protein